MTNRYRDRVHAGQTLAHVLENVGRIRPIVLGLPRGGVIIGREVAHALGAPLDVFVVRKLGLPGQDELAMGAIASGGVRVLNDALIRQIGVSPLEVESVAAREAAELARREQVYRKGRPPLAVAQRTVVLVDDGLATGFTMKAAITALKKLHPAHVVAAVPVGAASTCDEIAPQVDLLICPLRPEPFGAVGLWYDHFEEVLDEDVTKALAEHDAQTGQDNPDRDRWSA